ncbi:exosome complex component RRP45A-like [Salvia miltiorrhiza]|uniref:exosome complex component RRP45A-like n=1 Tax=Salvia miltiorrhiza TaxID=226208 RepID=UPI0025AC722B|nr:exosome complex component RRP45A-like [Salvia miltiorrhiza]
MEQRLPNSWRMTVNDKNFIQTALLSDLRTDGRGPFDYRNLTIQFGSEDGSSEVQLGQTRVMGFVTSQLVQPYRDRPNEGTLAIFTEFSPMADPSFEVGRTGESAVELGRIVDRGLRESRAIDTESLCVVAGKWVWSIRIDLHILDNGGNLVDAANIAALAALLTFRRPECTLGGEDGQAVIIHPPEVREPLPLIVHHLPVAVTFAFIGNESRVIVDPSHFEEAVMGGKLTATLNTNGDVCAIQKAGGEGVMQSVVMQCLRIASVKAADITGKIRKAVESYKTKRDLKKIKRHPDSVDISKDMEKPELKIEKTSARQSDDMEIESHSSKKDERSLRDSKHKAVIGGPSSWDPYSKVADADELKASLATQAIASPDQKMDAMPPEQQQLNVMDQSLRDADASPSLSVAARAGEEKNKAKTLLDAMKPKHKRKKKNLSNSDGS